MVEVGIPAFAAPRAPPRRPASCSRCGRSAARIGGLIYGALPTPAAGLPMHLLVGALLPLTLLPLAAAPSVPVMALLVIPAGCCIAPLLATRNELVGGVAPPGMRTEAYTWPMTAFVGGIAIGAAIAGVLVEGPGWRSAFLVAAAAARGRSWSSPSRGRGTRSSPEASQLRTVGDVMADPLAHFTPQVREWFARAFAEPTAAQAQAWPAIATGEHVLISAPTGSGKTLAAFLCGLDRFVARADATSRRGSSTSRR